MKELNKYVHHDIGSNYCLLLTFLSTGVCHIRRMIITASIGYLCLVYRSWIADYTNLIALDAGVLTFFLAAVSPALQDCNVAIEYDGACQGGMSTEAVDCPLPSPSLTWRPS